MQPPRSGGKQIMASERVYRRLLALYPKRFRREYGESMAQLFRDQHNAAFRNTNAAGRLTFWLRVLADLGLTVGSEHVTEFKNIMSETLAKRFWGKRASSFTKVFFAIFVLLFGVLAFQLLLRLPRVYSSMARVAVDLSERSPATFDPYFIQTAFARITSRSVLGKVIEEMNLRHWLAQQRGSVTPLKVEEAYEKLRTMVEVRQTRSTSLLEVRVFSANASAAAEIANKIVEVYRRQNEIAKGPKIDVVDAAEPGLRPVRPNVALGLVLGCALSVIIAAMAALLIRCIISRRKGEPAAV